MKTNIRSITAPIHQWAVVYLFMLHLMAFLLGLAVFPALCILSIGFILPAFVGSGISLVAFWFILPSTARKSKWPHAYHNVLGSALLSCVIGAAATALLCAWIAGDNWNRRNLSEWLKVCCYLPVPLIATWFGVDKNSALIQATITQSIQLQNPSRLC